MRNYLPIWIGLRYNRSSNRQRFLSLLSWISLVGMILGSASLIIVLSVMNGFQTELRDRMLELVSHGYIHKANGQPLEDWSSVIHKVDYHSSIIAIAPLVGGDVMVSAGGVLRAARLQGVDLDKEMEISALEDHIAAGNLLDFENEPYQILLGTMLAKSLGLYVGDKVNVILPRMTVTPLGVKPRIKQFRVAALFEVGSDMDSSYTYVRLQDAQKLYHLGNAVHAIRFLTEDLMLAPQIADVVEADLNKTVSNDADRLDVVPWTEERLQLFAAVKMEKIMVMFMLSMVIAVAAFNLISVLSMMVSDKRNEIAVLQMMGMSRKGILGVFLTQGLSLAIISIFLGVLLGIVISLNLTELIMSIESAFGFHIFDPDVFYISGLPSELQSGDVIYVFVLGILLSIFFTLYPAYQASKVEPVEALQYQ